MSLFFILILLTTQTQIHCYGPPFQRSKPILLSTQTTMSTKQQHYSQGLETYRVPMSLYAENRAKVITSLLSKLSNSSRGIVLLEGGKQETRHDTDHEPVFRQESYFHYLFGTNLPDCYGAISFLGDERKSVLFVPTWGEEVATVCGESPDFEELANELGMDLVLGVDSLSGWVDDELGRLKSEKGTANGSTNGVNGHSSGDPRLFVLKGLNTDSGNYAKPAYYKGIESMGKVIDEDTLFNCIAECRVHKSQAEIDLMRYTNYISSQAHVDVMRKTQPGMMEYQLESLFMHHTYYNGGCRFMSYTCICACGPNAKILHYGHAGRPNSRLLLQNDMALLDMGAEYHCYASDITCSFPVSGSFTPDQLAIYTSVLNAQVKVIEQLKPGVSWLDMHRDAEREVLKGLIGCGILLGGDDVDSTIECMLEADLGAIFMPHGLGHLIGIDTHDVGGYLEGTPPRSTRPGLKKLRTARAMEEGMVITVEPGCYFINRLLDGALRNENQKQFFNEERLSDFRGFGGVRLEDNVVITAESCENLSQCPRAPQEVLDVMAGKDWPPNVDVMPELKRVWATCKGGTMEALDLTQKA